MIMMEFSNRNAYIEGWVFLGTSFTRKAELKEKVWLLNGGGSMAAVRAEVEWAEIIESAILNLLFFFSQ